MRRLILALALSLAGPATAQTTQSTPPPSVAQAPTTQAVPPQYEAPPSSGLPAREAPPRTLRAYWHLFIAFAITWLLLFGYALSVGRRLARLDADLRQLRG